MVDGGISARWAEWLATPPYDGLLVDCLEFASDGKESLLLVNRLDSPLTATSETGAILTYQPLPFRVEGYGQRQSTEAGITITGDGLDGSLLAALDRLGWEELTSAIWLTWRLYLVPSILDRPLYTPPPRFQLEDADIGLTAVRVRAAGPRLPNKGAGIYYTVDKFIGLRGVL